MANALAKIIARKNQAAEKKKNPPGDPLASQLNPCPTCGSAIRWLNAAGQARCIGCQQPKFAALVRSREILVVDPCTGARRWETLVAMPDGRLLSDTGIRELVAAGELDPLTAASVGVGSNGEGADAATDRAEFDRWREVDAGDYFEAVRIETVRHRQNSTNKKT